MRWRPRSWVQTFRRLCQGLCLAAFFWLLLAAGFFESGEAPRSLRLFFDLDPLVFLATLLSTHTAATSAFLALTTVAVTVVLGRVFCGWVCPLGTVHALATWLRGKRRQKTKESHSPWHRAKYLLLVGLLVMALFGVHWIGVFDPISLLYRSVTVLVLPGVHYTIEDGSTAVFQNDPRVGPLHLTSLTEPVYRTARDHLFREERQTFLGSTLIALFFVGIVLLNLVRPRFWCRYICPLGGLLGLLARRPVLRLHNNGDKCRDCGLCSTACPAAAQPDQPGKWLPAECFGCWNCVAACKFNGINFKLESPLKPLEAGKLDLSRRATLAAGAGGMATLLTLRVPAQAQPKPYPKQLIRPPGARPEREFLQRCLQCGICMRACPTNALHPAALEGGLEAVWTPMLVPKIGYCEHSCTRCGEVCPTEAIEPLPLEEKQKTKIGLATVDTSRCLPYAYGRECIVCEEHCPTSPKAIYLDAQDVPVRGGETRTVLQPHVDPDQCTGCGVCEWSCVFQDQAAIRVTSANESRHPDNQPILPGSSGGSYGDYG